MCSTAYEGTESAAMSKSNIVLIGMPGVGKSTLGVLLAKHLAYDFIDTDLLIQNYCEMNLQDYIDKFGAHAFRDLETKILTELECEHSIISTGGSAIYSEEGMTHLKTIADVVYLKCSLADLEKNITNFEDRGLVMKDRPASTLGELFDERLPYYSNWSDLTIELSGQALDEAYCSVIGALKDACSRHV